MTERTIQFDTKANIERAWSGCGLAVASALKGMVSCALVDDATAFPPAPDLPDWQVLRAEMYDDMLEEMNAGSEFVSD